MGPRGEARGYLLVAPTAVGSTWGDVDELGLLEILAWMRSRYRVAADRVLLTGLSDGATFTLVYGLAHPEAFRALAPCCGVFHPVNFANGNLERARDVPIYLVHGAQDFLFPVGLAHLTRDTLTAAGARLDYRELPELSHTYPRSENPRILDWFAAASTTEPRRPRLDAVDLASIESRRAMPPGIQPHTLLTFIVQLALLLTAARGLGESLSPARAAARDRRADGRRAARTVGARDAGPRAATRALSARPAAVPDPRSDRVARHDLASSHDRASRPTSTCSAISGARRCTPRCSAWSIPFTTAFALGWVLPDRLLVTPDHRLIFALFLATALSISAIPVIARILTDLDLMRRNIGVVILGAGVTDDTTGWLLLSVIAGVATRGEISVSSAALAIGQHGGLRRAPSISSAPGRCARSCNGSTTASRCATP